MGFVPVRANHPPRRAPVACPWPPRRGASRERSPQTERGVGVAELPHDVHRVTAERDEQAREAMAELVRCQALRQRYITTLLEIGVSAPHGGVENATAHVSTFEGFPPSRVAKT